MSEPNLFEAPPAETPKGKPRKANHAKKGDPRQRTEGHQPEPSKAKTSPPSGGTSVARVEPRKAAVAAADGPAAGMLAMIREVAQNPQVDVEKMKAILDMQERLLDRAARDKFDAALVEMQPKLPVIGKDGRITVDKIQGRTLDKEIIKGTYAKWETINPLIKPILHEHGFSLTHRSSTAPDGRLRVTAVLKGHGHTDEACYIDLGADTTGGKNTPQSWASVLSYGKRHTACAVLNIVTRDEDDDARSAGAPLVIGQPITPEELEQLIALKDACEAPLDKLVEHLNKVRPKGHPPLEGLAALPQSRFDEAVRALRSYEAEKKKRAAAEGKTS